MRPSLVYLSHSRVDTFSFSLWIGHNNDSFGQPILGLSLTARALLCSSNSQLPLQFFDEPVLRVARVHNDRPRFTWQHSLSVHRMHVWGLYGAADHRLKLESRWKEVLEAGAVAEAQAKQAQGDKPQSKQVSNHKSTLAKVFPKLPFTPPSKPTPGSERAQ